MGLNERKIVVVALLIAFLAHYIWLNLRVRRLEREVVYAVSLDSNLIIAVSEADRNLDGSLDYETDFFSKAHVYSLYDAREIAKLCDGIVVNKHTKEIIEDYREECVDKQNKQ